MNTIAIMVTDAQLAIKANRNANEGFMFYAVGSPVKNVKFDTIVFACSLPTHVMIEWAQDICKNCLAEGGSVMGMLIDGTVSIVTPKPIAGPIDFKGPAVERDKLVKELTPHEKKLARRKAKKKAAK